MVTAYISNPLLPGGPPHAVASDPLHVRPLKLSLLPLETSDSRSGVPKKGVDRMALECGNDELGSFFHLREYEARIIQGLFRILMESKCSCFSK